MAKVILTNASILVNGVDLSTRCDQITIEDTAEQVDVTAFQGNGYREVAAGLKSAQITAEFFQDYSSGSVHSTLNALYQSGAAADVVIKASSSAVGVTNPTFTMSSRLFAYSGLAAGVGAASKISATFLNAGAGIVVATS